MRDLQKMENEARTLFSDGRKNDRYDLSVSETCELVKKFNADAQELGISAAVYELICRTYLIGMSSGMRFCKNRKGAKA